MPTSLIGRTRAIREVRELLRAGRSVLVVGPPGSGKTTIIERLRGEAAIVVDPFAGITSSRAAALRRALDQGLTILAAAPGVRQADMGHVGRIAWRFEPVYLRPLQGRTIGRIVRRALTANGLAGAADDRWISEAVAVSQGLPGRAVVLTAAAGQRFKTAGVLLPARMALVAAWQKDVTGRLDHLGSAGLRPGESS